MSILPPIARMLLEEHKRKPITGDILTIGRQSVPIQHPTVLAMMDEIGVRPRVGGFAERDDETVGSNPAHITDRSFFSLFSDGKVKALDVSGYEGAAIVHDLNRELPDELEGVADFLFDGSCLDNLFDPALAMRSMSRMLRPGGRLFCFNHATPIQSAYLCFSPEWFRDYFEANGYVDIRISTGAFESVIGEWDVRRWSGRDDTPNRDFIVIAVAEKGLNSTDGRTPIQEHYRALHSAATSPT